VERIDLDLDVGEKIAPKIGLECSLSKQPKFEPRWSNFLDYLVSNNLCIPEKKEALLSYPGYIREKKYKELFPKNLLNISQMLGGQYERVFFYGLYHIKLVYRLESKAPWEAKAYLYATHSLLTKADLY
jgi:hypothetical protein